MWRTGRGVLHPVLIFIAINFFLIKFVMIKTIIESGYYSFYKGIIIRTRLCDCPGFGGFIGNYTPARIDKSTGTFYPPVKQISFNRNLNHNDGLLIGRISMSSKINYGDARN